MGSSWDRAPLVVLFAGLWCAWVGGLVIYLAWWPHSTRRPLLRPGPLRRLVRSARAIALRTGAALLEWPHLIDVVRGSNRGGVGTLELEPVADNELARLRGARIRGTDQDPVLVVHSVITSAMVLDLAADQSVLGDLPSAHPLYLLDWPEPLRNARLGFGLDRHVRAVAEAIQFVSSRHDGRPVHVIGYCLGATVSTVAAGAWPALPIKSLCLIAPVIDVDADRRSGTGIGRFLAHPFLHPSLALDGHGRVPAAVVREAFHLLRPKALRTVRMWKHATRDPASRRAYTAMARWTWEQTALGGEMFFDLVDFYRHNPLMQGDVLVGAPRVQFDQIACPVLIIHAERDHIVPSPSSTALAALVPGAEIVPVAGGHVGMLVGVGRRTTLQPALNAFLTSASRAPPAR